MYSSWPNRRMTGDFWEPYDYYGASDLLALGFMDAPTNTIPYLPPAYSATRVYLASTATPRARTRPTNVAP